MKNLEAKAWLALAVLTVVMAFLLFVPAGTVHYWQAWVYLAIFAGVSALTTLDLIRTDQALLERRMRGGPTAEKQPRENTFTSATIEVAENQKVISTGPYARVRHPMYASAILYLLGTPLALGSYWGLVPVVAMMPFLVWRLLAEERFLARNLAGYTDYQQRIRHRLVPFVW